MQHQAAESWLFATTPAAHSTLATPVSNTARGAIAFESRGYMNFGFDFETDNLTGLGADLFINCLEFLVTQ